MAINIPKKSSSKGEPPSLQNKVVVTEKLKEPDGDNVPINFKVSAEFKRNFDIFAAMHSISKKELFIKAIEYYMDYHGK